jgi:flotillin
MSYVKCPPDMVYLISGLKKEPRVIIGKAALRVPFFERVDKLTLELIQIDVKTSRVPTADFINVDVDAVANVRIPNNPELIQVAARHFLNQDSNYIARNVQQVLEGNMREIIGQMNLKELVNNKQLFSQKIQENAKDDINNIGLEIVNLNVQSCTDENNAINDLGIDNLSKIQKDAKIAKAEADRDVQVAQAKAAKEGNEADAQAKAEIAKQNKDLALKQYEYQIEQDKKKAEADTIYEIQKAERQKLINENTVLAEVAKTEKETELKEKQVALREKQLDAEVRKTADAEKYKAEVEAEAQKQVTIQRAQAELEKAKQEAQAKIEIAKANKEAATLEAEAIKAKALAEAEGIKAKLEAEAAGIEAKGIAEAKGIEKKAEAQAKMQQASVVEMIINKLPDIAKEVSTPLSNIDSITMYGDQSTQLVENNTQKIDKILKVAQDSLGIDLKSIIAGYAVGKLGNNQKDNNKEEE